MQAVNSEHWGQTILKPTNLHRLNGKTSARTPLSTSHLPSLITEAQPQYETRTEYDDDDRHWSPTSQPFASAEVFLQYLRDGWQLQDRVIVRTFHCFSGRCVRLYYFSVLLDSKHLTIPVLENPVVLRLIHQNGSKLLDFSADCDTNVLLWEETP